MMKVKPAVEGAVIRDPNTMLPLPAEGAEVPETSYWIRRLNSGELVRLPDDSAVPTGREPVAPLTTRKGQ